MLKSIKRLTAIVLSFTVLFGTHGYAMNNSNNAVEVEIPAVPQEAAQAAQEAAQEAQEAAQAAQAAAERAEREEQAAQQSQETHAAAQTAAQRAARNAAIRAAEAAERAERAARNAAQTGVPDVATRAAQAAQEAAQAATQAANAGQGRRNNEYFTSHKQPPDNTTKNDECKKLRKDVITLKHANAKTTGIRPVKVDKNEICGAERDNGIFTYENAANVGSEVFVSSLRDFFLFLPTDINELERRSKLHETITNFYSLADVTAIDIENGSSDCYCCNCSPGCKFCCCGTCKLTPYAVLCVCGIAGFIVSIVYFLKDGIIDATEKTLIVLGAVASLGAIGMGFANFIKPFQACANGCGCCCTNYNFLDSKKGNDGKRILVGDGSVTPNEFEIKDILDLRENFTNYIKFDPRGKFLFADIKNWVNPKNLLVFIPLTKENDKTLKKPKFILSLTPFLNDDSNNAISIQLDNEIPVYEGDQNDVYTRNGSNINIVNTINELRRASVPSHDDFRNKFEKLKKSIIGQIMEINRLSSFQINDLKIVVHNLLCFLCSIPI